MSRDRVMFAQMAFAGLLILAVAIVALAMIGGIGTPQPEVYVLP